MSIPGHTKEESIIMFLEALRDPSNDVIRPQIKKALKQLGLTDTDISYYGVTGKRISASFGDDIKSFQDEMNEIDREFDNAFSTLETSARAAKKRISSVSLMAILGVVFTVGLLMSILIFSSVDDSKSLTKTIPVITEPAPIQDGDKL